MPRTFDVFFTIPEIVGRPVISGTMQVLGNNLEDAFLNAEQSLKTLGIKFDIYSMDEVLQDSE